MDLTNDDRAIICGALLWMADKLRSGQGDQAWELWTTKGRWAFEAERTGASKSTEPHDLRRPMALLMESLRRKSPDFTLADVRLTLRYRQTENLERTLSALKVARLPG